MRPRMRAGVRAHASVCALACVRVRVPLRHLSGSRMRSVWRQAGHVAGRHRGALAIALSIEAKLGVGGCGFAIAAESIRVR